MADANFVIKNGLVANGTFRANSTVVNAAAITATSLTIGAVTVNATTVNVGTVTINSTNFSGTANNSLYLGGTIASGYQTTVGLAANVATLTSNNASYLGGQPASSYEPRIPSGTRALFVQSAAPTGWTKDTNPGLNHALRVTGGIVGSGGSVAFTDAFTSRAVVGTVGATTLTWNHMPYHEHTGYTDIQGFHTHNIAWAQYQNGTGVGLQYYTPFDAGGGYTNNGVNGDGYHQHNVQTHGAGGGWAHDHSFTGTPIDLAVKYVDVIIATRD